MFWTFNSNKTEIGPSIQKYSRNAKRSTPILTQESQHILAKYNSFEGTFFSS